MFKAASEAENCPLETPVRKKKKRAQASGESPLAAHPWLLRGTLRVASAREDWTTFVAFFRAEEKNHR